MAEITIKGARVHNLKNIDVSIPIGELTVVTGLSGSGKSSLAFDTLYAEGQRRYVESLSSYARQFLGKIKKPDVDFISSIPPSIAIEQKVNTSNSRSTVGTVTEIYDYLKLLYARIGKIYSPISGNEVKRDSVDDVVEYIKNRKLGDKIIITSPIKLDKNISEQIKLLVQQGFTRVFYENEIISISEAFINLLNENDQFLAVFIDRIKIDENAFEVSRISDSIQTAFYEGNGYCKIVVFSENDIITRSFSDNLEADGLTFEELSPNTFSFNNPIGACEKCEGFGQTIGIDADLVIPNKNLSIYEDAIVCWKGDVMSKFKNEIIYNSKKIDIPIHKKYYDLTQQQKDLIWNGNSHFLGLNKFFEILESENYKIQNRVMLSRYRGKTICPVCNGTRLKTTANFIKINGKAITELVNLPIDELYNYLKTIELSEHDAKIAERILTEIIERLGFLLETGLSYLTLNRNSNSLSGGETQRINLTTSLGSSLVGSLYVLDEPSIGLHPHDNERLISILKKLRDLGNTVLVVEHDEALMKNADNIIDIGKYAGIEGGEIVFNGKYDDLIKCKNSLTANYLLGEKEIEVPKFRRKWSNFIQIKGANENNLKNIDVKIPLGIITAITGVSGSGKSTLIKKILFPALKKIYQGYGDKTGSHESVTNDIDLISDIEYVDQNPIGRSTRSNPVTYIKAYDDIRKLFANQQYAKIHRFTPSHFSFNVDGGRCEECQGEGFIKIEMQFMADITMVCENCKGKRFKQDVLDVLYNEKSIFDVLEMSVDEAIAFFEKTNGILEKSIVSKIKLLSDVGLGYVKLGQASSTLSGGESQRIKLASFLTRETSKPVIFVFDEPTTGLHFHDIQKLLKSINRLVSNGNTVIIIEHNLDVIKCADYIIDLGPNAGVNGGEVVFEGTPENIVKCEKSLTGKYLKDKLA
jgi:excinuclease ABC subunit A